MSEKDAHKIIIVKRDPTREEFKVLQSSIGTTPNPSRLIELFEEQLGIIRDRFEEPLAEAERELAEARAAMEPEAIEAATMREAEELIRSFEEVRERYTVQGNALFEHSQYLVTEIEAIRNGPLKDAQVAFAKRAEAVNDRIETLRGVHDRMISYMRDTEKLHQVVPAWLDINNDGVFNAQDMLEIEQEIASLEASLKHDPAVEAAQKLLDGLCQKAALTDEKLLKSGDDYRQVYLAHNQELEDIRVALTEEREVFLEEAEAAYTQLKAEKEETVKPFTEKADALIEQEWQDWEKYRVLQVKDAFSRVANSTIGVIGGFFKGIALAFATPFIEAANGFTKATKANEKKTQLFEDRIARTTSVFPAPGSK